MLKPHLRLAWGLQQVLPSAAHQPVQLTSPSLLTCRRRATQPLWSCTASCGRWGEQLLPLAVLESCQTALQPAPAQASLSALFCAVCWSACTCSSISNLHLLHALDSRLPHYHPQAAAAGGALR